MTKSIVLKFHWHIIANNMNCVIITMLEKERKWIATGKSDNKDSIYKKSFLRRRTDKGGFVFTNYKTNNTTSLFSWTAVGHALWNQEVLGLKSQGCRVIILNNAPSNRSLQELQLFERTVWGAWPINTFWHTKQSMNLERI